MLVHNALACNLWVNLNASKEFGFGAILFYVRQGEKKWPKQSTVEPIVLLFRLLTTAEKNYWPTKLVIEEFVWVIKKTRHLVKSFRGRVIIQTDHFSIFDIIQQSSIISTVSAMQMNVRLIMASQFLH